MTRVRDAAVVIADEHDTLARLDSLRKFWNVNIYTKANGDLVLTLSNRESEQFFAYTSIKGKLSDVIARAYAGSPSDEK